MVGVGSAASKGILVRGGEALEVLEEIDVVENAFVAANGRKCSVGMLTINPIFYQSRVSSSVHDESGCDICVRSIVAGIRKQQCFARNVLRVRSGSFATFQARSVHVRSQGFNGSRPGES